MLTKAQVERVHTLLQKVAQFIQHHNNRVQKQDVVEKDLNSLVSYVDKEAEERLVEGLSYILPEASFLTEEKTVEQKDNDLQWIIDPLDGTTNYLHGLPCYAISIGLRKEQELQAGFVFDIPFDNVYWAVKGEGAFKGQTPINVSDNNDLKQSLIATGFPYQDFEQLDAYMNLLSTIMKQSRGIRRLGSAAIDLVYTAEGRFDIFYEYGLNPWDVAGGALIVKEAGGFVCNFEGGEEFIECAQIVAGTKKLKKSFLAMVEKEFINY